MRVDAEDLKTQKIPRVEMVGGIDRHLAATQNQSFSHLHAELTLLFSRLLSLLGRHS